MDDIKNRNKTFEELSDRQREFLLSKMTDPETGTRHFEIKRAIAQQFWFEDLERNGWVDTIKGVNPVLCSIPWDSWLILVCEKRNVESAQS